MRNAIVAMLAALTALPALAQQTLVETIEVRVVNVDVVVRDRAGNPVPGLTKDDFELTVDGVRQPITNFYEVRRGEDTSAAASPNESSVPLELRQRRVVVFVDCASLTPSRKAAVLQSVEKFIDNRMRPEDRAMLVSWHMGLDAVTPFTSDKTALKRGLDTVGRFAPVGESSREAIEKVRRDILDLIHFVNLGILPAAAAYSQARDLVDRYSEQLLLQQKLLIDAVRRVAANMAGLDGKKVLRIPASAEAAVRAKPMTFTTGIRVNPGKSTLSVAIVDQLSGATGFARAKIVAR